MSSTETPAPPRALRFDTVFSLDMLEGVSSKQVQQATTGATSATKPISLQSGRFLCFRARPTLLHIVDLLTSSRLQFELESTELNPIVNYSGELVALRTSGGQLIAKNRSSAVVAATDLQLEPGEEKFLCWNWVDEETILIATSKQTHMWKIETISPEGGTSNKLFPLFQLDDKNFRADILKPPRLSALSNGGTDVPLPPDFRMDLDPNSGEWTTLSGIAPATGICATTIRNIDTGSGRIIPAGVFCFGEAFVTSSSSGAALSGSSSARRKSGTNLLSGEAGHSSSGLQGNSSSTQLCNLSCWVTTGARPFLEVQEIPTSKKKNLTMSGRISTELEIPRASLAGEHVIGMAVCTPYSLLLAITNLGSAIIAEPTTGKVITVEQIPGLNVVAQCHHFSAKEKGGGLLCLDLEGHIVHVTINRKEIVSFVEEHAMALGGEKVAASLAAKIDANLVHAEFSVSNNEEDGNQQGGRRRSSSRRRSSMGGSATTAGGAGGGARRNSRRSSIVQKPDQDGDPLESAHILDLEDERQISVSFNVENDDPEQQEEELKSVGSSSSSSEGSPVVVVEEDSEDDAADYSPKNGDSPGKPGRRKNPKKNKERFPQQQQLPPAFPAPGEKRTSILLSRPGTEQQKSPSPLPSARRGGGSSPPPGTANSNVTFIDLADEQELVTGGGGSGRNSGRLGSGASNSGRARQGFSRSPSGGRSPSATPPRPPPLGRNESRESGLSVGSVASEDAAALPILFVESYVFLRMYFEDHWRRYEATERFQRHDKSVRVDGCRGCFWNLFHKEFLPNSKAHHERDFVLCLMQVPVNPSKHFIHKRLMVSLYHNAICSPPPGAFGEQEADSIPLEGRDWEKYLGFPHGNPISAFNNKHGVLARTVSSVTTSGGVGGRRKSSLSSSATNSSNSNGSSSSSDQDASMGLFGLMQMVALFDNAPSFMQTILQQSLSSKNPHSPGQASLFFSQVCVEALQKRLLHDEINKREKSWQLQQGGGDKYSPVQSQNPSATAGGPNVRGGFNSGRAGSVNSVRSNNSINSLGSRDGRRSMIQSQLSERCGQEKKLEPDQIDDLWNQIVLAEVLCDFHLGCYYYFSTSQSGRAPRPFHAVAESVKTYALANVDVILKHGITAKEQ